ncbi:MAG TPA: hypothetical protein VLE43_11400 [Candidatus Saccharimonadia bacterium]|nr:hypothetical protein [Candidatus Saccharimonadia bacterium]
MIKTLLLGAALLAPLSASSLCAQSLAPAGVSISNRNGNFNTPQGISSLTVPSNGLSKPEVYQANQRPGACPQYPWKTGIVATIFWVGELPTENNPVPNTASSWDPKWMKTFGGYDCPDEDKATTNFKPAKFTPMQNPFYFALPYNDVIDHDTHKEDAKKVIPWFKGTFKREGRSVLEDRWIAIRFGDRVCYAQWGDCGPFVTDDADYVFGNARPKNVKNDGAGLDISPAVRDYLGFRSGQQCDWKFVEEDDVPDGPWKTWGTNNPFSLAHRRGELGKLPTANVAANSGGRPVSASEAERIQELRRQRDLWFQNGGAAKVGK